MQETTCKKDQIWGRTIQHLYEFKKSVFTILNDKPKKRRKVQNKQYFDYEKSKSKFLKLAKSGKTMKDIREFFTPYEFRKLRTMLREDESIKRVFTEEEYFDLFELDLRQQEVKKLLKKGLTIKKIAKVFKCTEQSIIQRIKRMKIKKLLPQEIYFNLFELNPMEQETKKLLEKGLTKKEIVRILCLNKENIRMYEWRIKRKPDLLKMEHKWKSEKFIKVHEER